MTHSTDMSTSAADDPERGPVRHDERGGRAASRPAGKTRAAFEPEFAALLKEVFEVRISFNQLLGLKIDEMSPDGVVGHIDMRPELIGHFTHHRAHGGVISAGLDAMGGLAVMAAIGARHHDETPQQRLQRFGKLSTVDLRVDYLRPAVGPRFALRAQVMRLGSRVASTRMAFESADGRLFSTGAGVYMVA